MNFYQQNYFRPYHQLIPKKQYRHQLSYQSPPKQPKHFLQTKSSLKQFTRSPSKTNISPYKHVKEYINQQPIWQHLYQLGIKNKKQILLKHQISKKKIDLQCTFKPEIKQNRRYLIRNQSKFLQRNNIWQENKIEKAMIQKQNVINRNLQECTFKPHLNRKKQSLKESLDYQGLNNKYYENQNRKNLLKQKQFNKNINPYYHNKYYRQRGQSLSKSPSQNRLNNNYNKNPLKNNKSVSKLTNLKQNEMKDIKKIIKQQLKRINV